MLLSTASRLSCPQRSFAKDKKKTQICAGSLILHVQQEGILPGPEKLTDIQTGELECHSCGFRYPILAGVAVVLEDPHGYLLEHAKGVSTFVENEAIPEEIRSEFQELVEEIREHSENEHQEEDLEAERVNALYLMNHYLRVSDTPADQKWWVPQAGEASPLHRELIEKYWDHGPISRVALWMSELHRDSQAAFSVVELGCGVGGVWKEIRAQGSQYLGIDTAFASIVRARHLALGALPSFESLIPDDLLKGGISRPVQIHSEKSADGRADFIIADVENPPLATESFDVTIAMNLIDMLENPGRFPKTQFHHLKPGGIVLQSCPYIWHPQLAGKIRSQLPRGVDDSASAAENLYEKAGFQIERRANHIPWLFFKHARQLELYSVHLLQGRKPQSAK